MRQQNIRHLEWDTENHAALWIPLGFLKTICVFLILKSEKRKPHSKVGIKKVKISYRKLQASDAAQYRAIRLESLKAHPENFGSSFEEQNRLPKLMFEKALEQPVDHRFVIGAFDQEELIGICGFVPFALEDNLDLHHAGTIIQMYVRSTYSGRGIGLGLARAALREAFKLADIEQIVLTVKEGNISARRVYEQAGFQPYSSEPNKDGEQMMIIRRGEG